ncbi:helix-turn-helix domain-containing protein [Priestia megaterium]|uniref:helix-turn-helix domain-containing protein n=1 Tax=Priestia megaterium TaxID=1404 RepID=UPI001EDB8F12|nr:helix-turn-helix transcriptional regulator [Priestia megaterium]MDM8151621.1 helix-turn-helix transcriptional regulator [Priestia megaterium]MDN3229505.1 helix-turn-helix transcriptional regulator [Priestia megaterium]UKJ82873.1 helix-turn-helix transcriptional regulator [Priestia megaterium]
MKYSFGETLKKLRGKTTQDQLAKALNDQYGTSINKSMISKWENNKEEPRIDTARFLADYFDVSLDYLLGIEKLNNKKEPTPIQTIAAHLEGKDITEEKMKEVLNYIDYVFSKQFDK